MKENFNYIFDNSDLLNSKERAMVEKQIKAFNANNRSLFFNPENLGKFANGDGLFACTQANVQWERDTGAVFADVYKALLITRDKQVYAAAFDKEIANQVVKANAEKPVTVQENIENMKIKNRFFRATLFENTFDLENAEKEMVETDINGYALYHNEKGVVIASSQPISTKKGDFEIVTGKKETRTSIIYSNDRHKDVSYATTTIKDNSFLIDLNREGNDLDGRDK